MKINEITLLALGLICTLGVRGQRILDTLYANESKNVALFFPSPIQRAATGHEGFVFSYDREEAGYFGLLQGMEGPDSNLLVITTDGYVYAYILTYAKELSKLNQFVQEGDKIGLERPIGTSAPKVEPPHKDSIPSKEVAKMLLDNPVKVLAQKHRKGLVFRLEDIRYFGNEAYLVCGLKNRSGIDFEIGYLDVLRVSGSKKRRASYQEIQLEIKQAFGLPQTLNDGDAIRFVVVLPKFVPGDNERLKLDLREAHGNRVLKIIK